jgi:hypothetical protein
MRDTIRNFSTRISHAAVELAHNSYECGRSAPTYESGESNPVTLSPITIRLGNERRDSFNTMISEIRRGT